MYHHYDGYPEGVGHDLYEILKEEKAEQFFDDPERLAGYLTSIDNGYESEPGDIHFHADIEYLYIVNLDSKTIRCLAVENWDGFKVERQEYLRYFNEWPEEKEDE